MKIAIVGGGRSGVRLMEVLQQHQFQEFNPRIQLVADTDPSAPGIVLAEKQGIPTTADYRELFSMDDLDLIIELTNDEKVFQDILQRKNVAVRAISAKTAKLFWEIGRVSQLHRQTRDELQATQAKCTMIMDELIHEDVMVIDSQHRIIDVNKNMLEKIGLLKEEVIGRHCYEISHRSSVPCTGEDHPCPLIRTMESHKPYQTTHVHIDKKNQKRYISISTYPMIENGRVIGAIEISRDITRDINMQKTMMQQEKLASIGRLSAGVAHEINNPLTTILTSAMLIQEDMAPDHPAYEELEVITAEALRCRKIVTSLLDFARQNQPDKKLNDLNEIVAESILLIQKQAAFRDITVRSQLAPSVPPIMLDKGQIQQALINLILNAVEATDAGGRITITTHYPTDTEKVRIEVADTGSGIDKDQIDKIFDPFFTTKESGTGLGLAITHGIVEQHGGTIRVKSKPGRGTCFSLYLPVAGV